MRLPSPTLPLLLVALCQLAACSPTFKDSGSTGPNADSDGDGAPDASDCAPDDPTIRPGADEICDGLDQDCDDLVDEGLATTGWVDADGDGFGDTTDPACDGAPAYAPVDGDCDDTDVAIHPGVADPCDDVDNDCDGATDEDGTSAVYLDFDGDGYGDDTTLGAGCEGGDWTTIPGDCDDYDPTIGPDAAEACDTIDNDCDGYADNDGVCPCDVAWWPDGAHPYMFCTAASDWQTADDYCAGYGYRLTTFDSAEEGEWVEANVLTYPDGPSWWIGFTDAASEATWTWTDGSPVTYTNWTAGEPNNSHGGECVATTEEDCAMIKWNGTAWNDYPCACATESAVCEGQSQLRPD